VADNATVMGTRPVMTGLSYLTSLINNNGTVVPVMPAGFR